MLAAAGIEGIPRGAATVFPGLALGAHRIQPLIAGVHFDGARVADGSGRKFTHSLGRAEGQGKKNQWT